MNMVPGDFSVPDVLRLALDDLDPPRWGPSPAGASGLMKTVYRLRQVPLEALRASDLRVLVSQGVGLAHVLALAVQILLEEPLVEATYYEGDLLLAVIEVQASAWAVHGDAAAALSGTIAALPRSALAVLPDRAGTAIEQFVTAHGDTR